MPTRIYDISKKLGLENKEVLVKAKELGIAAARVASSSLDKLSAEYLEQQLIVAYPERIAPTTPSTPKLVRISEIANTVGLPADQVQAIVKEFSVSTGPAPDLLDEDTAQELMQLIQGGRVTEKRLTDLENGGRSLSLQEG